MTALRLRIFVAWWIPGDIP